VAALRVRWPDNELVYYGVADAFDIKFNSAC